MSEVPRRLAPTQETVRRLFLLSGNQCAYPGCTHPIVLDDGTYVGEVCHIRAAEPGGERFDSTQNNDERRAFENLLLLCHDHHVVTNDLVKFPIPKMMEMKANHEARFERGLAEMLESAAAVQITDSIVSLGGKGGSSPGAGGGGGGAIGPGARGGDGGQGGEIHHGCFEVSPDLVELRVHVGEGGRGAADGRNAEPGGDTYLEAVFSDGSVKEVMRARGGGAASGAGNLTVRWAALANSAEVRNGLLFVLGGGWWQYTVPSLSHPVSFTAIFVAEADHAQSGTVDVVLLDPAGNQVLSGSQSLDFKAGPVPAVFQFFVPLNQVGTWVVVLSSVDRELQRLPFEVAAAA